MSETTTRHKAEAPKSLNFAVIVCSSSRYEHFKETNHLDDPSGDLIVKILVENGHRVTMRRIIPDDKGMIQHAIMRAIKSRKVDAIITCGGTGISPRDVTIEAVKPLLEKELEGFGEVFRFLSYGEIGSAAILTRALAGVSKGKAIFCIPGSPGAAKTGAAIIAEEAAHIIKHLRQ